MLERLRSTLRKRLESALRDPGASKNTKSQDSRKGEAELNRLLTRGSIRRALSTLLTAAMFLGLLAPAIQANGYGGYGNYYGNYGSYDSGYYSGNYGGTYNTGSRGYSYGYQPPGYQSSGSWDDRGTYSDGGELGRSVGGSVGMAAGFVGGAAIAAAVLKASAFAAMGPLVPLLVGTAITLAGGFIGGKLLSRGGSALTRALGKRNTWMLLGAVAGTIAGIALLPALGPLAGAGGLVIKGVIGGVVGGVIGRLFSNQLETIATPRFLMAGMGAVLGGLAGNIPGAIAGAAGGYAMGAIFDDHFFSKPGDSIGNFLPDIEGMGRSLKNAGHSIGDWFKDKQRDTANWWDRNWDENSYGSNPYYQHSYNYAYGPSYGYGGNPYSAGDSSFAYDTSAGGDVVQQRQVQNQYYEGVLNAAEGGDRQAMQYLWQQRQNMGGGR